MPYQTMTQDDESEDKINPESTTVKVIVPSLSKRKG
jgi:hypothetical protein